MFEKMTASLKCILNSDFFKKAKRKGNLFDLFLYFEKLKVVILKISHTQVDL